MIARDTPSSPDVNAWVIGRSNEDDNPRESILPASLYAKLDVFKENRRKAERSRLEQENRARLIREQAANRVEQLRQKREVMVEKHKDAVRALEEQREINQKVNYWHIEQRGGGRRQWNSKVPYSCQLLCIHSII